jgi:hypothetical protein
MFCIVEIIKDGIVKFVKRCIASMVLIVLLEIDVFDEPFKYLDVTMDRDVQTFPRCLFF